MKKTIELNGYLPGEWEEKIKKDYDAIMES